MLQSSASSEIATSCGRSASAYYLGGVICQQTSDVTDASVSLTFRAMGAHCFCR